MPVALDQQHAQQQTRDPKMARQDPVGKFIGQRPGPVILEIRLPPEQPTDPQYGLRQ